MFLLNKRAHISMSLQNEAILFEKKLKRLTQNVIVFKIGKVISKLFESKETKILILR